MRRVARSTGLLVVCFGLIAPFVPSALAVNMRILQGPSSALPAESDSTPRGQEL